MDINVTGALFYVACDLQRAGWGALSGAGQGINWQGGLWNVLQRNPREFTDFVPRACLWPDNTVSCCSHSFLVPLIIRVSAIGRGVRLMWCGGPGYFLCGGRGRPGYWGRYCGYDEGLTERDGGAKSVWGEEKKETERTRGFEKRSETVNMYMMCSDKRL